MESDTVSGFKQNLWTLYAVYLDEKLIGYVIAATERGELPFSAKVRVHKVQSGYAKVESYRDFLRDRHPDSSLLTPS